MPDSRLQQAAKHGTGHDFPARTWTDSQTRSQHRTCAGGRRLVSPVAAARAACRPPAGGDVLHHLAGRQTRSNSQLLGCERLAGQPPAQCNRDAVQPIWRICSPFETCTHAEGQTATETGSFSQQGWVQRLRNTKHCAGAAGYQAPRLRLLHFIPDVIEGLGRRV